MVLHARLRLFPVNDQAEFGEFIHPKLRWIDPYAQDWLVVQWADQHAEELLEAYECNWVLAIQLGMQQYKEDEHDLN